MTRQRAGPCSYGEKENEVEDPRIRVVHVGVEIPRMKVGTGVSRKILSQVPKFTLNRGEMPLADDSNKEVERMALPQRAGMTAGGWQNTCVDTEVSPLTIVGGQQVQGTVRPAKVRQALEGSVCFVCWLAQSSFIQKGFDEMCLMSPEHWRRVVLRLPFIAECTRASSPYPFLPKVASLSLSKPPTPKSCHQSQAGPDTADGW